MSWDGSASQSIISDGNLECASSFISGSPESSFFAGCLVGALSLTSLTDSSFGRKNLLLFSIVFRHEYSSSFNHILYQCLDLLGSQICHRILQWTNRDMHGRFIDRKGWNKMARSEEDNYFSAIKDSFGKRWALKRLLIVMVLSFSLGMMFYGAFNMYLAVTFNALMEFPSYLITFFFVEKANRRTCLLAFSVTSGICNVDSAIVDNEMKGIKIVLELGAYFCVCAAYNVLLIYSIELFPTCVRNTAATMVEQSQAFGAIFSPMLISASRGKESLSYGVFGVVLICCGFFVACLPETRGQTLRDTMDQQECKTQATQLAVMIS
ncbi:Organic cation/carnitine transporter [Melia azedarach]|uniref:Organic cation/carnitine transporter n=1 Tax=Melia azedarach TaxID=155640 RepID=A0ACC1X4G7_MELAZ|nr:Organic cation/carnitine transporter [Melia azedarach]